MVQHRRTLSACGCFWIPSSILDIYSSWTIFRLYVQCCTFEGLEEHSSLLYQTIIKPGEYFEGEEQIDEESDQVISFDVITNIKMIRHPNSTFVNFNSFFFLFDRITLGGDIRVRIREFQKIRNGSDGIPILTVQIEKLK